MMIRVQSELDHHAAGGGPFLAEFIRISEAVMEPTISNRIIRFGYFDFESWKKVWYVLERALQEADEALPFGEDNEDGNSDSPEQSMSATEPENHETTIEDVASSTNKSICTKDDETKKYTAYSEPVIEAKDDEIKQEPTDTESFVEAPKQRIPAKEDDAPDSILDKQDKELIEDQIQVIQDKAEFAGILDAPKPLQYPPRPRPLSIDHGILERWAGFWDEETGAYWTKTGEPQCWPSLVKHKVEYTEYTEKW